ncbi:MAG: ACT domain-containing protein [Gemmatimonadaceae bacterium]
MIALTLLTTPLALYRLPPSEAVPDWTVRARDFLTISRTPTELSIVADEAALPEELDAERGYRAFRVNGPLPLDLIGIFAVIASPLADAEVPIFPIATFDTDYVLVPGGALATAIAALEAAGHRIVVEDARGAARTT